MEWMIPLPGGRTKATLEANVGGRFQIDMIGEGRRTRTKGSISGWSVRG
jgi:hypothetical protein